MRIAGKSWRKMSSASGVLTSTEKYSRICNDNITVLFLIVQYFEIGVDFTGFSHKLYRVSLMKSILTLEAYLLAYLKIDFLCWWRFVSKYSSLLSHKFIPDVPAVMCLWDLLWYQHNRLFQWNYFLSQFWLDNTLSFHQRATEFHRTMSYKLTTKDSFSLYIRLN